jgi:hypothetical protein
MITFFDQQEEGYGFLFVWEGEFHYIINKECGLSLQLD